MSSFKTLLTLAIGCAFLAGAHAASNNDGEGGSPTVIEKTGGAIEHGAKAAGHGIERGLQATGRALNKASDKVSEKLGIGKPADNAKAGGKPLPQANERSG